LTEILLVAPGPYEVALTRVPAGVSARLVREDLDPIDLPPAEWLRYASAPGSSIPWGATWSTWMGTEGIRRYRHARDRSLWIKAASMAAPKTEADAPRPVYVAHVRRTENGRQVWVAVSVRQEARHG
jgi:hypothetical protein